MESERNDDRAIAYMGVLGPIEAWDASGRAVHLTNGQQRVLLALLQAANQPVAAVVLHQQLWPGASLRRASALLQTNVSGLRKELPDPATGPALQRFDPGYILRIDRWSYDWARFEHLRTAADRAVTAGADAFAEACLVDARRLWRGEVDFGVGKTAFAEGFVRQLEEARLAATVQRFEVGLRLGRHYELVPEIVTWTEREPLNDELVRLLMVALARCGRQVEALRAFDRFRRKLKLHGLTPDTALRRTETELFNRQLDPPPRPRKPREIPSHRTGPATVLLGRWRPFRPPCWAMTDSEICLLVEDHGGEVVAGAAADVTATFDEPAAAVAAAVTMQESLAARGGPLGRFAVHEEPALAPLVARAEGVCDGLLAVARAGQILVAVPAGSPPASDVGADVDLRPLGDSVVPGSPTPLTLYQVESPRIAPSRQPRLLLRSAPRHNLPASTGRLVGRDRVVDDVARHLVRERLVTLHGPGGCGKTHIARHVATALLGAYRHGAWLVELEGVVDGDLVIAAVVDVVAPGTGRVPDIETLARLLGDRELLLVLDSCEGVLADCGAIVQRLVASCPGISILVTSLERLGLPNEHAVAVLPFEPPAASGLTSAEVRASPAVVLFADQVAPTVIGDDELEALVRICRLVDGIPLAIGLAAARAQAVGIAAVAAELEEAFSAGGPLELLEPLVTTIRWCVGRLEAPERDLLGRLSVLVGGFGIADARALEDGLGRTGSAVDPILRRLVARSAVVAEPAEGEKEADANRFRLLESVRHHVAGHLTADPAYRRAIERNHSEVFLSVARKADNELGRAGEGDALARLDACAGNLRAAMTWAIGAGEAALAIELGARLWRYWFSRGRLRDGWQLLIGALALDPTPSRVRNRALVGSSYLAWWLGEIEYTRKSAMETLAQAEAIADPWAKAWGVMGLAASTMFHPDRDESAGGLDAAVEYLVSADLPWDAGQALQLIAGTAWHAGDYRRAEAQYARAVAVTRVAGSRAFTDSLQAHGLMLALLGHREDGAAEVETGLELAHRHGHRTGVAHALTYRAAIEEDGEDHEEAARMYLLGLQTAYEAGEAWVLQWALGGVAAAALREHLPELAARLVGRALAMESDTGIRLAPRERALRAQVADGVVRALGPPKAEVLVDEGRRMSTDEAVRMALELDV